MDVQNGKNAQIDSARIVGHNPNYKQDRDKFLTELIGEKWHEVVPDDLRPYVWRCWTCGEGISSLDYREILEWDAKHANGTFSDWPGFGKLMTWLKNSDLWQKIKWNMAMAEFMDLCTDPDKAADKLYEYLKEK